MLLTSCHANTIVELYYNLLQNNRKTHKFVLLFAANHRCVLYYELENVFFGAQ